MKQGCNEFNRSGLSDNDKRQIIKAREFVSSVFEQGSRSGWSSPELEVILFNADSDVVCGSPDNGEGEKDPTGF